MSIAILIWSTQACCCGGTPLMAGPPGRITGQIDSPPTGAPGPLTVYAVNADAMRNGHADYAAMHLPAPATTFTLTVPPGYYLIVARLDGVASGGAGYTFNFACIKTQSCGTNSGDLGLIWVRVDSMKTVSGIYLGDWGTGPIAEVLWRIDSDGSPLPLDPAGSPSPVSLPSRSLPPASPDLSVEFTSTRMGLTLGLPPNWAEVNDPNGNGYGDIYVSNEKVGAPLELGSKGVWLTIRLGIQQSCPSPDWRFTTAMATLSMQEGPNRFFFENPAPRDGPQPFTGYSVRGGEFAFGNCIEFTLTAPTESALDDNLAAFAAILQTATFRQICNGCATELHPVTSA